MASSHNRIIKKNISAVQDLVIGSYKFEEEKAETVQPKPEQKRETLPGPKRQKEQNVLEAPKDKLEEEKRKARLEKEREEILEKAREQRDAILNEARREAEEMKKAAEAKAEEAAEKAREDARQEGYQAGLEEGKRQGQQKGKEAWDKQISSFETEMRQALESVKEAKERCLHTYLDELKDCAVAIAEKVIHISLKSSGDVIRQMIIAATEKLNRSAWVKIYIDRPDYEMLLQADQDILSELSHLSDNIKFVVMDQEKEGSCIIERPEEVLDISVNSQMENIKDILANV